MCSVQASYLSSLAVAKTKPTKAAVMFAVALVVALVVPLALALALALAFLVAAVAPAPPQVRSMAAFAFAIATKVFLYP
jgi:hypothetical protein